MIFNLTGYSSEGNDIFLLGPKSILNPIFSKVIKKPFTGGP